MPRPTRLVPTLLLAAALAPAAAAQQFSYHSSLPGGFEWTEGVEAADVDRDGDQDLFTANGEGLYAPSTKLQAGLIVNRLELGAYQFTDESLPRLGVALSHGKNVNTADVGGDGWVDALFSNAFQSDPPFLFVNRGEAQPGYFDEEGSARGLNSSFSSAGASFGDVDNDGDLDLVIGRTGPDFNGPPGALPVLYRNTGGGVFVRDAAAVVAPAKIGNLDVDLVDIDLDWDLDIWGTNRGNSAGGKHHLLLNDGLGQFTNASPIGPDTSTNVYESDLADLDGDTDLDVFFLSLVGFSDGYARNDVVEQGTLGFTEGGPIGGDDDNEVVFVDHDMDGDLDVVIGSLGQREKLVRNDGAGVFVQVTNLITNISDKTLDVVAFDVENDGDYDLVTVQGESSASGWDNKLFLNSGPADDRAPTIQRVESLAGVGHEGPWVVRAQVRDEVQDDGVQYVTGDATYRVDVGTTLGAPVAVDGLRSSGSIHRFEFVDTAAGQGTRLVYELTFTDVVGNASSTGEVIVPLLPCGFGVYGTGTPAHTLILSGAGSGQLGTEVEIATTGATGGLVLTGLALDPAAIPFAGGVLLLDPASLFQIQALPAPGGAASWTLTLPSDPAFAGLRTTIQSVAPDGAQPGGFAFSLGLELVPCE